MFLNVIKINCTLLEGEGTFQRKAKVYFFNFLIKKNLRWVYSMLKGRFLSANN